jgi:molybdopterin/thiamine biosynthesis adenylyltransferase
MGSLWEATRREALSSSDESVAFLTAKHFETRDKIIMIADDIVKARPQDYLHRSNLRLEVSPLYTSRVLSVAEDKENTVIMVHSHPFDDGKPRYSPSDNYGEALTSETISNNLIGGPPVGSLLIGQRDLNSRVWLGQTNKHVISSVTILNTDKYWVHYYEPRSRYRQRLSVDRQVRVLGNDVQSQLEELVIGVVGLGGTGSIIAEQLARVGAKKLIIVDHDDFEQSNWSRLYGSSWSDVKKKGSKVSIVKSHLKNISKHIEVTPIKRTVMSKNVLLALASCDVIFSCLDRHSPRAVLNELSYQCYVPVIDVGVGVTKGEKNILGGSIRATVIGPGLPCLFCQEMVRPEMITTELLSPEEYNLRRAEGYVNSLGNAEPSIISYTSMAGSLGMMMFFDLLLGHDFRKSSIILFDIASKETLKLYSRVKDECVCTKRLGAGLAIPFSVAD